MNPQLANDWFNKKAQDPYCYSSRYQGMWLRRFIVERVTQSLRRMIYDTPRGHTNKI